MSLHPDRDQAARLLSTRRWIRAGGGMVYQLHVDTSSTPRATLDVYTGRLQYSLVDSSELCGSGFGFVFSSSMFFD